MLVETKTAIDLIVTEYFASAPPLTGRRNARELLLSLLTTGELRLHAGQGEVMDCPVWPPFKDDPAVRQLDRWDATEEVLASDVIAAHMDTCDFDGGALVTLPLDAGGIAGWPYPWRGPNVVVRLSSQDDLEGALANHNAGEPPEHIDIEIRTVNRPDHLPESVIRALDIVPRIDHFPASEMSENELRTSLRTEMERKAAMGEPAFSKGGADAFAHEICKGRKAPAKLREIAHSELEKFLITQGVNPSKSGPRKPASTSAK
ncbi:hypothetical protein V5F41_00055 [Xanthobacter autotrophicus]|uniref:hypothetical protein n=1 Tax=Xanthobacter autotrophicus TaxID=280 RepID=UPI003726C280